MNHLLRRRLALAAGRVPAAVLVLAALLAPGSQSRATTYEYEATIDGWQEIPPSGSPCVGHGLFTINDETNTIHYEITFDPDSLLGYETAAHIHCCAPPGETGPIMVMLPLGSPKIGDATLFASQVESVLAGLSYVNIHTGIYPSGEIRGQILPVPTPVEKHTWGKIKARYR